MFELKFAITEQKSVSSQALGISITLPALAEESDPSISSQPFSGWILAKPVLRPCLKTIKIISYTR